MKFAAPNERRQHGEMWQAATAHRTLWVLQWRMPHKHQCAKIFVLRSVACESQKSVHKFLRLPFVAYCSFFCFCNFNLFCNFLFLFYCLRKTGSAANVRNLQPRKYVEREAWSYIWISGRIAYIYLGKRKSRKYNTALHIHIYICAGDSTLMRHIWIYVATVALHDSQTHSRQIHLPHLPLTIYHSLLATCHLPFVNVPCL